MILQALKGYYDRVAGYDPATPRFGYGFAPISFALILEADGTIVDVNDLREKDGSKSRPTGLLVPKDFEDRTSGDAAPRTFWDKIEYVFAVSENAERAARRFRNFRDRHVSIFGQTDDIGLKSILLFLAGWDPENFASLRYSNEMLAESNVVFRLNGEQEYIHERPAARATWERSLGSGGGASTQCLVTGGIAKPARLHPLIKNIARAGEPTPKLVSFDKDTDAFDSFGKKQGDNAPVSEEAAFSYTTALNDLLRREKRQRVQISDATTVYWAEAVDPKEAEAAERVVPWFLEPPSLEGLDTAEVQAITDVMTLVKKGKPLEDRELHLKEGTKFYILGLSPNAARLSVRFWEVTTLGKIGQAFHRHWQDLHIEPTPWRQAPSSVRLILELIPAAERKGKSASKLMESARLRHISGEVMRSVLGGRPYPRSLFTQIIARIRADGQVSGLRAAMLKACLVRNKEAISVSLDRESKNPGYRLGRLFAVLDAAQRAGIGKVNAGVREKFMGAASAAPARVFPVLLRNYENHLSSAKKKGRVGRAIRLDKEYAQIVEGISMPFPPLLNSADQGQFFVAFHLQQTDLFKPREKGETIADEDKDEAQAADTIEE